MAILNFSVNTQNLIPVNGQYVFTTTFLNLDNSLSTDVRFPQNQVFTTSTITNPLVIPVEVEDGDYTINNIKVRISYKNKNNDFLLINEVVSCSGTCSSLPIQSIADIGNNTIVVTLSDVSVDSYGWKILDGNGLLVTSGVANVSSSSFNIVTGGLATGKYLLELNGNTCVGKTAKDFSVVSVKPACPYGPTLSAIQTFNATSLRFLFSGTGIFGITWRIKSGSTIVRSGMIAHTSVAVLGQPSYNNNTPTITYALLDPGTYEFEIEGYFCSSTPDSDYFVIPLSSELPLAFISEPVVTPTGGSNTISYSINKTATYNTILLNSTTGVYYRNLNVNYTSGVSYVTASLPSGSYYLKVGTLERTINIAGTGGSPCDSGPSIGSILNKSANSLEFLFAGVNVFGINWKIKQGGAVLRSGNVVPVNNHPVITFAPLTSGDYTLEIEGSTCTSTPDTEDFNLSVTPIVSTLMGAYSTVIGGREWTYTKSPKMSLSFNNDGSVSDNTAGLVHGNPTTFEGKLCFYMMGYSYLSNNGNYKTLQNIQLPDGIYTLRRFDCNPSKIPNFTHFKNQIHGYPQENGVNEYNATLSEVTLTVRTLSGSDLPAWMKTSRVMNWPENSPFKPISKSIFGIETINQGDVPELYHSKGVHTSNGFNSSNNPFTFRTYKWPYDLTPGAPLFTDNDLYNFLRNHINQWGLTPDSIITDEVEENAQGQDPNIAARNHLLYKGAFELFQERYPGINKKDTNLFGGYGSDDYTGFINKDIIYNLNRTQLASWIRDRSAIYFTANHVSYRNVNVGYYMYNAVRNIPFELLVTNERVKVPTIEIGKESDWAVFTATIVQTLVMSNPGPPYNGAPMGIEESHTGYIIPFPNGEIWRYPATDAMIQEQRTLSFWSRLVGRRGTMMWGAGSFGKDATKIEYYTGPYGNWPVRWRPTGDVNWQNYVPGVNGAPANDDVNGIPDHLAAMVIDASKLGHEEAENLTGVNYTLYYASYTSSKKTFVATPGDAGYHLNGFGALNLNMLAMKDAYDQGCGVSLIGETPNYKFAVYWSPYSVDEYEDNVIVTHGSLSYNFGRVPGRKTVFAKFNNTI